jgi:hypothetical protein
VTVETLEGLLAEIVAARDTPVARRLALDAWSVGKARGEAEGCAWARMVLDGARRLNEYEAGLKLKVPGGVRGTG